MRRTTPDLTGSRKTVYTYVSIGLLALSIAYVLWANYVVFVGGNLPLTHISLGTGSTAGGLVMLFIGDLVVVLALWFLVDGVLLTLLNMVLRTGSSRATASAPPQEQQQWQQPQQPQQWQPQAQQQWQPQPQAQPQAQQQWQPQAQAQQAWPSSPPPTAPPAPAPRDGSAQGTLVAPHAVLPETGARGVQGLNDAAPVHRRWTPPAR
jgi:hypothetical protein